MCPGRNDPSSDDSISILISATHWLSLVSVCLYTLPLSSFPCLHLYYTLSLSISLSLSFCLLAIASSSSSMRAPMGASTWASLREGRGGRPEDAFCIQNLCSLSLPLSPSFFLSVYLPFYLPISLSIYLFIPFSFSSRWLLPFCRGRPLGRQRRQLFVVRAPKCVCESFGMKLCPSFCPYIGFSPGTLTRTSMKEKCPALGSVKSFLH